MTTSTGMITNTAIRTASPIVGCARSSTSSTRAASSRRSRTAARGSSGGWRRPRPRDTPGRPNVLRLIVGEETGASVGQKILVLEAEMDDLSPQLCGPLLEKLFATGALDVYYTAIQMKKGRPGILVTVLVEPDRREAAEEVLFAEATTLGVRRQEWERTVLDREIVTVETPYGPVGVKVGRRGGRSDNAQPEFEDCQRAAPARGLPGKEG